MRRSLPVTLPALSPFVMRALAFLLVLLAFACIACSHAAAAAAAAAPQGKIPSDVFSRVRRGDFLGASEQTQIKKMIARMTPEQKQNMRREDAEYQKVSHSKDAAQRGLRLQPNADLNLS